MLFTMLKIMATIAIIAIVNVSFDSQDMSKGHSKYWNSINENGMIN